MKTNAILLITFSLLYSAAVCGQSLIKVDINTLGNVTVVCKGQSIQLSANATVDFGTPKVYFRWYPRELVNDSTAWSVIATPVQSTVFTVKAWLEGQSPINASKQIIVHDPPVISTGKDVTVQTGQPYQLNATAVNFKNLKWTTTGKGLITTPDPYYPLSVVYVPGAGEKGTVVITLTAEGLDYCSSVSKSVSLLYTDTPTSNIEGMQGNGIGEIKYLILPNPCTGHFIVRLGSNPGKTINLKLVNPIGQMVEVRTVAAEASELTERFDVSHLSKGIYNLVISSDRIHKSEKIVIK